MKKLILNICLLATISFSVQAQSTLQSPDDFLGYELGTRFTPHHKVVAYYQHVASVMSNVTTQRYGQTNELRPLMVNMISSQENMDKLEQDAESMRTSKVATARDAGGTCRCDSVWGVGA